MDIINAIIVDDERPAKKELIFQLKSFPEITIVGEAVNIADATSLIMKHKPDIVFHDIQLAGENGFDLLEKVSINFKVIFVTAYDEYTIKAFEANATDYMLKPVDLACLEMSLKRILENPSKKSSNVKKFDFNDSIYLNLNNYIAKFLEISSIIGIKALSNYINPESTTGNSYIVLKTM